MWASLPNPHAALHYYAPSLCIHLLQTLLAACCSQPRYLNMICLAYLWSSTCSVCCGNSSSMYTRSVGQPIMILTYVHTIGIAYFCTSWIIWVWSYTLSHDIQQTHIWDIISICYLKTVSKASLLDKYSFLAHSWLFIFHIVFPIFWVDPCEHLSHVFPIFWDDLCKHLSRMFSIFWDDLCEHLSHEFPIFWDDRVNIFHMSSPSSEMIMWISFPWVPHLLRWSCEYFSQDILFHHQCR